MSAHSVCDIAGYWSKIANQSDPPAICDCPNCSWLFGTAQNEYVGGFKHAPRRDLTEGDVNAAMYVQFEASSNVVRTARLAVGGKLSTAAAAFDLTPLLAGRSRYD